MKKILFLTISLFIVINLYPQTQGISYQAIIIDQNAQEIAGVDVSGNIIPNRAIMVRFTILDEVGTIDYQEEQATSTDSYGMINLTIGQGIPTASSSKIFTEIDWNGASKRLKVDLSLSQADVFYTDFSNQELNFVPYAYHKNITATGTLKVDEKSTLQDLSVEATTNLNGSLDVNNFNPTHLSGILSVDKNTTLGDTLTVNSASNLNGQVLITSIDTNGADNETSSYPLLIQGSNQGIAIKVNGSRNNSNNFVTFWDAGGTQGRIEGETKSEIATDPEFIYQNLILAHNFASAITEVTAAATSSTPCIGLAPCFTTPSWWEITLEVAQLGIAAADIALYNAYRMTNAGVTYQSGGADYAEYLPKANPNEEFYPGDIVGIKGGYISRSTENADKIMIISGKPIVLGNMPKEGMENASEKVAFLGQVDTKVLGIVNIGDFIIPSGKNDGTGIAVSADSIKPYQYLQVAGIAWSNSKSDFHGYINVAVGLNTTDVARLNIEQEKKIKEQEKEIHMLQDQLDEMNNVLARLLPEYAELMGKNYANKGFSKSSANIAPETESVLSEFDQKNTGIADSDTTSSTSQEDITYYYYEVSREQVAEGLKMAREILEKQGKLDGNPLFTKLEEDLRFKETYIDEMLSFIKDKREENYKQLINSGAKVVKNY